MNLRIGRFGKQEGASIIGISVCSSGIFAIHAQEMYAHGNSSYISAIISAMTAIGLFLFVLCAMRVSGCKHLMSLIRYAFGGFGASLATAVLAFSFLMAASEPLSRAILVFGRFIYVESEGWSLLVYIAPVIFAITWMGMETLGRTARLLVWVLLGSIVIGLLWAASEYQTFRLFPLIGNGIGNMLWDSLQGLSRFLPGLAAWLCVAQGAQGLMNTKCSGLIGGITGGAITAITQTCLGMTYTYNTLTAMRSPMYHLTMMARSSSVLQRLDQILLFFWLAAMILSTSFYAYAAALLLVVLFKQKDIRPAAASICAIIASLILITYLEVPWYEQFGEFYIQYGWIFIAAPLLIASITALIKAAVKKRKGATANEAA